MQEGRRTLTSGQEEEDTYTRAGHLREHENTCKRAGGHLNEGRKTLTRGQGTYENTGEYLQEGRRTLVRGQEDT